MAHFAQLDNNNVVTQVIVIDNNDILDENNVESEVVGQQFCTDLLGGLWMQTSYNGNIRKNYAGIGDTYDDVRDAFIAPQPFASWVVDENTCRWEAPVAKPQDNNLYRWNEELINWELVNE